MELNTAINLIQSAVTADQKVWADIGAGTGLFTQALDQLLPTEATIYAVDKSPHFLYRLALTASRTFHIQEGDFDEKMDLPLCDGIIMANALHYSQRPIETLNNIFQYLKIGGKLLLIEYETSRPNPPWVPYPIPFEKLKELCASFSLSPLKEIGQVPSMYGAQHIYAALCERQ